MEGVYLIKIHDIIGPEEDNMLHLLDSVVSCAVLMSWYHFCGKWSMFPRGIIGWIQSGVYICVVVVQIFVYVLLLVMSLGGWIW